MERDGKTVYLILYVLQKVEQGSALLYTNRHGGKAEKNFWCTVFAVFGKTGNRNMQFQFVLDNLAYDFHLSFTTIG